MKKLDCYSGTYLLSQHLGEGSRIQEHKSNLGYRRLYVKKQKQNKKYSKNRITKQILCTETLTLVMCLY